MATNVEALNYLRPEGGYVAYGSDYEGIQFIECEPFTEEEYKAAFAAYDAWKAEQDALELAKREAALAKLAALGLDTDDLKALGF